MIGAAESVFGGGNKLRSRCPSLSLLRWLLLLRLRETSAGSPRRSDLVEKGTDLSVTKQTRFMHPIQIRWHLAADEFDPKQLRSASVALVGHRLHG